MKECIAASAEAAEDYALVLSTGRLSEPAFLLPYLHAPVSWGHDLEGRDGRLRAVVLRVLESKPGGWLDCCWTPGGRHS